MSDWKFFLRILLLLTVALPLPRPVVHSHDPQLDPSKQFQLAEHLALWHSAADTQVDPEAHHQHWLFGYGAVDHTLQSSVSIAVPTANSDSENWDAASWDYFIASFQSLNDFLTVGAIEPPQLLRTTPADTPPLSSMRTSLSFHQAFCIWTC